MPRLPGLAEKNTSTSSAQKSGSHTRALRSWNADLKRGASQISSRLQGSHNAGMTSRMK